MPVVYRMSVTVATIAWPDGSLTVATKLARFAAVPGVGYTSATLSAVGVRPRAIGASRSTSRRP